MHSLTMEDSAVVPMATEDGHDRVLNFETIICGCAWASVEAGGKRHGQHLRYRYPDGEWEFFLAPRPQAAPEGFERPGFDASGWAKMPVPGCW